jgi:hypothetical protein
VLRVPAQVLRDRLDAWFPLGKALIEGLYGTARSIESTLRQREYLVTLGKIAAGLTHEINNPAAASARAVDALETTCQTLLSTLRRLADEEVSAGQFAALDALRREVEPATAVRDPLALADQEDALSAWLNRHGVEREWIIAPPLAAAGIDVDIAQRIVVERHGGMITIDSQPGETVLRVRLPARTRTT